MVIDENGLIVSKHNLKNDFILSLAYNCPKFTINLLNDAQKQNANNLNRAFLSTHAPPSLPSHAAAGLANSAATAANTIVSNLSVSITNMNNSLRLSNNLHSLLTGGSSSSHNATSASAANDARLNSRVNNSAYMLACSFKANGLIYLLKTYDDIDPIIIDTNLEGIIKRSK